MMRHFRSRTAFDWASSVVAMLLLLVMGVLLLLVVMVVCKMLLLVRMRIPATARMSWWWWTSSSLRVTWSRRLGPVMRRMLLLRLMRRRWTIPELMLKLRELMLLLGKLVLHLVDQMKHVGLLVHVGPALFVHLAQILPHDLHFVQDLAELLH